MIYLDFTKMRSVVEGVDRGQFVGQPNFIGGRRDGQLAPVEFQLYRRSYQGVPIPDDQPTPPEYYLLFVTDNGLYHYIHNSALPVDFGDDSPAAG